MELGSCNNWAQHEMCPIYFSKVTPPYCWTWHFVVNDIATPVPNANTYCTVAKLDSIVQVFTIWSWKIEVKKAQNTVLLYMSQTAWALNWYNHPIVSIVSTFLFSITSRVHTKIQFLATAGLELMTSWTRSWSKWRLRPLSYLSK